MLLSLLLGGALSGCAAATRTVVECPPAPSVEAPRSQEQAYAIALSHLQCRYPDMRERPECYQVRRRASATGPFAPGPDDPPWNFELLRESPASACGKGSAERESLGMFQVTKRGEFEEIPYP